MQAPKFYSVKRICLELEISKRTFYRKVASGLLPPPTRPNPLNSRLAGWTNDVMDKVSNAMPLCIPSSTYYETDT